MSVGVHSAFLRPGLNLLYKGFYDLLFGGFLSVLIDHPWVWRLHSGMDELRKWPMVLPFCFYRTLGNGFHRFGVAAHSQDPRSHRGAVVLAVIAAFQL